MNKEEFIDSNMKLSKEDIIYNYYETEEKLIEKLGIERELYELKERCKKQKEVVGKTINAIDLVIELIKQQPTEDDRWILNRLNGFKIILEDKEV